MKNIFIATVLCAILLYSSGCAMMPGGIAPSTTPIEGRPYTVLGRKVETDSRVYLFGILPVSGPNTIRDAVESATKSKGGDAMINVTVETYGQYWILFTRFTTRVEGDVIRFD